MRAVVQRVSSARVTVEDELIGKIGVGLLVLVGVEKGDVGSDADYLANKIIGLRIFADDDGKMNQSLLDIDGAVLAVSQFTLLGDVRKGRRPSFVSAADPDLGNRLYLEFVESFRNAGVTVATGKFQADMQVELVNDGPVTILLDSRKLF